MELVVALFVGIAWPAAIVWVAMLFRSEIRSVLRRVSQLKYKDLEASFDEGLVRAEAKAAVISPADAAMPHKPELTSRLSNCAALPTSRLGPRFSKHGF